MQVTVDFGQVNTEFGSFWRASIDFGNVYDEFGQIIVNLAN